MSLTSGPRPRRTPRRPLLLALVAGLLAALLGPVSGGDAPPAQALVAQPGGGPVGAPAGSFWVSSPTDPARRLLSVEPSVETATAEIVVDPSSRHQRWWGTGAALTDASRSLLADRPGAVAELFGPRRALGARLNLLRLPLSATDFSPKLWTWRWNGTRAAPTWRGRRQAALVRTIVKRRPDLRVVGVDWSAPAALKESGTLRGGALRDTTEYGDLLVSQASWLTRHGVPLWAMSLGNEPGYSTDYATMTMTDAQMIELGGTVGPRLDALGVGLWAVDHNWSDRPRVDALVAGTPGDFDAAAFHCYRGNPGQMAGLGIPSIISECTGTTGDWAGTFAWDARNLVVDAVAAGSSGLMLWNLALDEQSGPLDTGSRWGCKDCRGLLTVTPDGLVKGPEFYTLAQLSRAASPRARVVSVTATAGLRVAAFRNRGGSIGVFGHNGTGAAQRVTVRVPGQPDVAYEVGAGELFTYRQAA